MRPVNSMSEFKQIIGRGTRLFDGKEYFTIYDFVDAYHHFADPEWDENEPVTFRSQISIIPVLKNQRVVGEKSQNKGKDRCVMAKNKLTI
jgi:type I restriction enzyme R subunit